MKEEDFRRIGGLAGGAVFIMSLLLLLLKATPFNALLWSLAAGMVSGIGVYVIGSVIVMGAEPATPEASKVEDEKPSLPDETRLFSARDIPGDVPLDQTVRIEPGTLDYILPEISPEQVLKDREGLDIGALEQGIEASRKARDTIGKSGDEQGGF